MRREEALRLLREGRSDLWNSYRRENRGWVPDLRGADLSSVDLVPFNRKPFDLRAADLRSARLPPRRSNLVFEGEAAQVEEALFDMHTENPSGFDLAGAGARFVSASDGSLGARDPSVFLSYAHGDGEIVLAIHSHLRRRGLTAILDRCAFQAGEELEPLIRETIADVEVVLVFYSAQSAHRRWTTFEREVAEERLAAMAHGDASFRVIYVTLDDSLLPSEVADRIAVEANGRPAEELTDELIRHLLRLSPDAPYGFGA